MHLRRRGTGDSTESLPTRLRDLDEIQRLHPNDGRIGWALAGIHHTMGALQKEYEALTVAIEQGHRVFEARLRRAFNERAQGRWVDAIADLHTIIASPDVEPLELSAAADALRSIDKDWFAAIQSAPAVARYDAEDRLEILEYLTTDQKSLPQVIATAREVLLEPISPERDEANSLLVLSLIGAGWFLDAMSHLASSREEVLNSRVIRTVFNYAIAEWGASKHAPADLFGRVVELNGETLSPSRGPNYNQCIALAHAALGNVKATTKYCVRAREEVSERYTFSCWRYLLVSAADMVKDTEAIENFARHPDRREFLPTFLTRAPLANPVMEKSKH